MHVLICICIYMHKYVYKNLNSYVCLRFISGWLVTLVIILIRDRVLNHCSCYDLLWHLMLDQILCYLRQSLISFTMHIKWLYCIQCFALLLISIGLDILLFVTPDVYWCSYAINLTNPVI